MLKQHHILKAALLIILLVSSAFPVIAQDAPVITCTADDAQTATTTIDETLAAAKAALSTGDIQATLIAYRSLSAAINTLDAFCHGLQFAGDNSQVIGPVTIPTGVYTVTSTMTPGEGFSFISMSVEMLTGECGSEYLDSMSLPAPQENIPSEAVFRAVDCSALIEVSGTGSWTLSFTRVS